jgi:hypothetical protein
MALKRSKKGPLGAAMPAEAMRLMTIIRVTKDESKAFIMKKIELLG